MSRVATHASSVMPVPDTPLAAGSVLVVVAEASALPVAFVLAAFLTRRLGPTGYGLYALAWTVVAWIEWTVASMLSRAIVREASSAGADETLASAALQLNLIIGITAAASVWLTAPAIGWLVHDTAIVRPLRWLSLDIPFFTATMAHRGLLVGGAAYGARAMLPAARWLGRLVVVTGLVALGWSLDGAVAGCVAASALELAVARTAARPSLVRSARALWPRLLADALPFLALGLTLRLFDRIDLVMFKTLGGSTADAGIYAAAQAVAMGLTVVSIAFPQLLLARLTRLHESADRAAAAATSARSLRAICWLLPVVGIAYGAGDRAASWMFGPAFEGAGRLLAPLALTALTQVVVAVIVATLTAAGAPNRFLRAAVAMLLGAMAGGALVIPRYGAMGAALVTCAAGLAGAAWGFRLAWRIGGIMPPLAALARAAAAAVVAGVVCHSLAPVLPLAWTLLAGALMALVTLQLTGELSIADVRAVASTFRLPRQTTALGEVEG